MLQEQQSIWKGKGSMADSAIALEEPSVGVHLAERQMVGWKGGARMCEMQGGMGVRDGLMYSSRGERVAKLAPPSHSPKLTCPFPCSCAPSLDTPSLPLRLSSISHVLIVL